MYMYVYLYIGQGCGYANKRASHPLFWTHMYTVHVRALTLSSGLILATELVDSNVTLKVVTIGSKVINSTKTKQSICLESAADAR